MTQSLFKKFQKQAVTGDFAGEERTRELDYEYVPETEEQFYNTINNASFSILEGMGFEYWGSINELANCNRSVPESFVVSVPIYGENGEISFHTVDLGRKPNYPIDQLEEDEYVILFPQEWYDIIPEGFIGKGLFGEEKIFNKSKIDREARLGCIAFGFTRKSL